MKSLRRDEVALVVDGDRQLRQRTGGRAEDDRGAVGDVELRLVAGAQQVVGLLLVQGDGASDVRAHLGVGDDAVVRPVGPLRRLVEVLGQQAHEQHDRLGLLLEVALRVAELGEVLGDDVDRRAEGDVGGADRRALGVVREARPLLPHRVAEQRRPGSSPCGRESAEQHDARERSRRRRRRSASCGSSRGGRSRTPRWRRRTPGRRRHASCRGRAWRGGAR